VFSGTRRHTLSSIELVLEAIEGDLAADRLVGEVYTRHSPHDADNERATMLMSPTEPWSRTARLRFLERPYAGR
jgi:hypothetical protein